MLELKIVVAIAYLFTMFKVLYYCFYLHESGSRYWAWFGVVSWIAINMF